MCKWLSDLAVGFIGGALSGIVVNVFSRKSDKKELQRFSLRMLKNRLEEYKRNTEAMSIDRMARGVLCDEKTQETIKELQKILFEIKKDLIHCPKEIQDKVLEFDRLCNKKDKSLIQETLERKNGKSEINIVEEVKKIDNSYLDLIQEIDKYT